MPGTNSNRWGLLDKPELAGDMTGINAYLTEEQKAEFKTVPVEMKKGYGSFHLTCWVGLDDATTENGCIHAGHQQ